MPPPGEGVDELSIVTLDPGKGWKPVRVEVWPGETASIVKKQTFEVQRGPFREKALAVRVLVTGPRRDRSYEVVARPSGHDRLETLAALGAYLQGFRGLEGEGQGSVQTASDNDGSSEVAFAKPGGPYIRLSIVDAVVSLEEVVHSFAERGGEVTISHGRLLRLLEQAYQIGRDVRDAEYPAASARSGGITTGMANTAQAEAWRRPFLTWLQNELEQRNAELSEPLSLPHTVDLALKCWPPQGFGQQRVAPERSTIENAIRWGTRAGIFHRPVAKRGRKGNAGQLN